MNKNRIVITWGEAPGWVKSAVKSCMGGKHPAHITVIVGTKFKLGQPTMDWSVVYYFARDPRGHVTQHRAAVYRDILGSSKTEQMLYMGGTMTLRPGYQVLRVEHTGYKIYVALYMHPTDFAEFRPNALTESSKATGPNVLTDEEKVVLAIWKGYKSQYRRAALSKLARHEDWDRAKVNAAGRSLIAKGFFKPVVVQGKKTVRITPKASRYYEQHWSELSSLKMKYHII